MYIYNGKIDRAKHYLSILLFGAHGASVLDADGGEDSGVWVLNNKSGRGVCVAWGEEVWHVLIGGGEARELPPLDDDSVGGQ